MSSKHHIFGVRHHGPGSARVVLHALAELQPDIILVEGPPDADSMLPLLRDADMIPPVALLVYAPDDTRYAASYPFAIFSPEYQALRYGLERAIPVRFMDLPQAIQFRLREAEAARQQQDNPAEAEAVDPLQPTETPESDPAERLRFDPLGELAKAAGFSDGERWWEVMIEQRRDSQHVFDAVQEAMTALRQAGMSSILPWDDLREASMRRILRAVEAEGFQRIAVVCGAWHVPALADLTRAADDDALLADLPAMPVEATWTPWTYSRLSKMSGYGAGVWSPGWYEHVWEQPDDVAVGWLTKVAHLLRGQDLSASPAQVIDAVRLSETLAALRQRPLPGLEEFNEAALSVFCFGNDAPLHLIAEKLIIGEKMGTVPDGTPMTPLQRDLKTQQTRLKLRVQPQASQLRLDLTEPAHLERSHLLHRLEILNIPWGVKDEQRGRTGTFQEVWLLVWQPELTIRIIEKSIWGNTVYEAATAFARHQVDEINDLSGLTTLVNRVLLSDLPDAIGPTVRRLQSEAAATGDVSLLMTSLPALADVLAYGNVRQTDADMVRVVIDSMVARVCIGLPLACASLNEDAARDMFNAMLSFTAALQILHRPSYQHDWQRTLRQIMNQRGVHGLIRGRCCRTLFDGGGLALDEAKRQMALAVTMVNQPNDAAAWLMGFLAGSGMILIHDTALLEIIDVWVMAQHDDHFEQLLPLMRRTFATFTEPERRHIGHIISGRDVKQRTTAPPIDTERASALLPTLAELLGLDLADEAADESEDRHE